MLVIVVYDISTMTSQGIARLNRVAKICSRWGMRVQNSVFECEINADQYRNMVLELESVIDVSADSIRFYSLGNHYENKVKTVGRKNRSWKQYSFVI